MVKNQNGVTLIELLAVIVLTSVIIAPLMFSLVSTANINHQQHIRQSSVSVADGALYGFDKLSYTDLDSRLNGAGVPYMIYDSTTCATNLTATDDQTICAAVFGAQFNSVSFTSDDFKVVIYDYNLDTGTITDLSDGTYADIPQGVRDEIALITPSNDPDPGLLRISIWIEYDDEYQYGYTTISGLLIGDWTDAIYE